MSLPKEVIAKFRSARSGEIYEVIKNRRGSTYGLSCNCKGWIFRRACKHIDYVVKNYLHESGALLMPITDIPTFAEAERMDYGKNAPEKIAWTNAHIKEVVM